MIHKIKPAPNTLYGAFSREFPPALFIESGDAIQFQTLDAGWGLEPPVQAGISRKKFEFRDKERDKGHALCGPIAIRGAKTGMVLEVHIEKLIPDSWGWTYSGGWYNDVNKRLNVSKTEHLMNWQIDAERSTAHNQLGHQIKIAPFLGIMGMPPDVPGLHSTWPPRPWGGNIDCKELTVGSKLFLPIPVDDGLFFFGDGHAAQGDGEICSQAIECPIKDGLIRLTLKDNMTISSPIAETPNSWITFGFHENLGEAVLLAADAMLDLLVQLHKLDRTDALALASVVVNFHITQIVNGVRGVHAVLPHSAIQ